MEKTGTVLQQDVKSDPATQPATSDTDYRPGIFAEILSRERELTEPERGRLITGLLEGFSEYLNEIIRGLDRNATNG